jgi:Flp pilus assembly protein TadB
MTPVLLSPLVLVIEVLAVLALWFGYVALVAGVRPATLAPRAHRVVTPLIGREMAQASALGWRPRTWLAVRVAGVAGGAALGVWAGTPLTIAGGIVLGLVGVPYVLASRAERRRLAMEQAMVEMVRTVSGLVRGSNQTLDAALTDQGLNPHPALRDVMRPLADTRRSIRDRLLDVDRRFPSPIANRVCLDLLVALTITPEAFLDAAVRVLLPQYERDLEIRRRTHAIAAGARQSAFIVVFLMLVMYAFVLGNGALHDPYQTVLGQLVLALVAAMVGAILWLIHALTPRSTPVRWDLAAMSTILERRHG